MRITGCRVGLLINFNKPTLIDGVKRFVLKISVSQCPLWLKSTKLYEEPSLSAFAEWFPLRSNER
jgi:hypothetical protein